MEILDNVVFMIEYSVRIAWINAIAILISRLDMIANPGITFPYFY
ncbi:hypothetical protein [Nostoc sp.]